MGVHIFDQYSYLHFAVGVIAYFWALGWKTLFIVHVLFEYLENTSTGMYLINNYLPFWPGKKTKADAIINQVGDSIISLVGWWSAYYVDQMGVKYHWYEVHLKNP